ncbi:hypothetical protein F4804DRAFT_353977 [Jackrogersella minutella]|nr:hypothetical protein F4804DRAFT_353977 [Jackrogersella minutella]
MSAGNRPKEVHTKHLTELERFRVRTLYYDAAMSKRRIAEVTGYSISQIRTAIRAKTAAVPPRSGRPKRSRNGQPPTTPTAAAAAAPSSQDAALEDTTPPPSSIALAAPAQPSTHPAHPVPPSAHPPPPPRSSLSRLPPSIRRLIYAHVLLGASPGLKFQLTWLRGPPCLLADPDAGSAAQGPRRRHAAAMQLYFLCREARAAVLDHLTPVWAGGRAATPPFFWLDLRRDVVSWAGAAAADPGDLGGVLLRNARAAVLPRLRLFDFGVVGGDDGWGRDTERIPQ